MPAQPSHGRPLLEVIATSVEDGVAAERGGADRLEVVSAMEADGLTPDLEVVRRLREAVAIPLRVMLRRSSGFVATAREVEALAEMARRLRAEGIGEYVMGFLTSEGVLDREALLTVREAAQPAAWTLHRAFDHTADARQTFAACAALPGVDLILSAGSRQGVGDGLAALCERAAWQTPRLRWLAGGRLRAEHVAPLVAAGITQFHTGRAVRIGSEWAAPVDAALVRRLNDTIAKACRSGRVSVPPVALWPYG